MLVPENFYLCSCFQDRLAVVQFAMPFEVISYSSHHQTQILSLSLRAWEPVFAQVRQAVQPYVYNNFYPNGWDVRQTADIETFLRDESDSVWVACLGETVVGWVGVRLHPEDKMGEIYILAVDPDHQRQGIGAALLDTAHDVMREAGMAMVMVETGDEDGHVASRATYERAGFVRWPVARYFKEL
jgi:GNAT superfamily N-acetyltransferase